ncbi:hypothetical protein [Streptomyces sp. NPDC000983]|uniref:hypothetical protein n=1 Tax=Streptomyces sp. NPDC000983 TaxID=3154373 RepID=UPI003327FD0B
MTGPLADFPDAAGLSGLDVYPWPTEDGKHGGSPHMHLTCAECYVVVSGRGRLETLGGQGHQTLPLHPEAVSLLDASGAPSDERARARRDLAMEGFNTLKQQWYDGDRAALADFYRAATELVGPRLEQWRKTVTEGPLAAAEASLCQIGALETGDFGHLGTSGVRRIEKPRMQSLGMCGLLHAYYPIRRAVAREELHTGSPAGEPW